MLLQPSRIALAQTSSILGDVKRNVEHHAEMAEQARAAGAHAVIFPELSLTGYVLRDLNFECAIVPSAAVLEPLKALSKEITIIAGGVEEDERGAVHNAAFVFEGGEIIHIHRKIYLPTYGIFEEARYFTAGRELRAFTSERLGRIGVLVCEDLWHPALPYILSHDGAQMILTIAASPTRLDTGEDAAGNTIPENYSMNREHHAAYARLMGSFVTFVNRVGVEDGVNFWGGSEVVAPSGETLARGAFFDEDLVIADIDPSLVKQARQLSRHVLDDDLLLTRELIERVVRSS